MNMQIRLKIIRYMDIINFYYYYKTICNIGFRLPHLSAIYSTLSFYECYIGVCSLLYP